ncbi:MAG: RNA polymerase sigma factor [Methylococcales bacterium]
MKTENKTEQQNQEADLIELICRRDEKALELLYHRFYSRLFRFIARTTARPDHIDEVINDVMYVVWEKAHTYNRQCQLSTWIFGIAFNKARQSLRNGNHDAEQSFNEIDTTTLIQANYDDGIVQIERDNWLEFALDVLSPEQRAVIELTYYQGLHYSEIAELMGCPENTVKTRMHYARKKLVAFLKNSE